MGDHDASDVGQGTHVGVLRGGGLLHPSETILHKGPLPRGSTWEGVYQDDHGLLQMLPVQFLKRRLGLRDEEVNDKSQGLYEGAGLIPQVDKKIIYESDGSLWGSQIDGIAQQVSWSAEKRVTIGSLTLQLSCQD